PSQLSDLDLKAPLALFVRGRDLRRCVLRSAAVVGARAATAYGATVAGELGAGLADRGWSVVSGGAYGIDAAAHRGSLAAGGVTVAVLACGVDVAYPRGHVSLFERIAVDGVVVSELPPGCHPTRSRFLTRNRLIAALSRGTVVVEAAHRSGALNTAASARHLHRPVLGVPGPVTSPMSAGVHRLLRQYREEVAVVTGADDVVEELGPLGSWAPDPVVPAKASDGLSTEVAATLEALPVRRAVDVERLARTAGLPSDRVLRALDQLRLLGLAELEGSGWRLAEGSAR
ncbi:MAG: DNA-processing protein DprA, partial [Actinomycetes bacterium]